MNSWHLKYFIEAAKNQSLQSAAQKYFVTPSAISQAIKSLEAELGSELLVHQKRMFSLTPAGSLFLERATALISEIDKLPDLIKSSEKDPQGVIKFVALRSFFTEELARQIVKVKKKYPKLDFQIRSGSVADVKKFVRDGEFDFGMIVDDHQTQGFADKTIAGGDFVLFSRTEVKVKNLENLIITNPEKIEIIHLLKELKKKKMSLPDFPIEILSWSMIRSLVLESDYVGYAPDYMIRQDIKDKTLKILDLGIKPFPYENKIIWPQGKALPLGAKLLLGI